MRVYERLLRVLAPPRCPGCAGATPDGLCPACRGTLPRAGPMCARCALPLPVARCPARRGGWGLAGAYAALAYDGEAISMIHAAKFEGRRDLAWALGLLLADTVTGGAAPVDALVAVPLHPARWRERGYNQALEIARPVAARLRLPLWIAGIERSRVTGPQAELGAAARSANVRGAFRVRRRLPRCRIAIVDDVLTTGSTVNALGRQLLDAGALEVHAWAVARALPAAKPVRNLVPGVGV